jgi:hypothetical protein
MPLTYANAESARAGVLKAFGIYLPDGLADKVRARRITDIVQILPQDQYKIQFSKVFYGFFAYTNVSAFGQVVVDTDNMNAMGTQGGTVKLVGAQQGGTFEDKLSAILQKRRGDDALGVINCPAFTSPAVNVLDRKIYVNASLNTTSIGTLYHEFIHFLQHGNLYPELYALGGNNIGILEGITEFFTRRVDPLITQERTNGRRYQPYFDNVTNRTGAGMPARNRLLRYCFQGEPYVDLGGMKPRTATV